MPSSQSSSGRRSKKEKFVSLTDKKGYENPLAGNI